MPRHTRIELYGAVVHLFSYRNTKPSKTCAVLRYGGLGDALQAISILPWLKSQGYHITFYTVPEAYEVIRHDPHIDRFIIQDADAIANRELGEFWAYTAKKYDRFINLSESTERSLLAMPGNTNHGWSHAMRHKYLNLNYMEFIHDIAGAPMPARVKFYPTAEEQAWAHEEKQKIGGRVILWVLSGSAVHKVWPHMDTVIDTVLRGNADARFVLVGDAPRFTRYAPPGCKILESGWEETPQVHLRSGKWTIRQTMTFAQQADLVIGPETGAMNAVSLEAVPKIVTLSHSSITNLTRDWVNCVSLTPVETECYPCHQIHFDFTHCNPHPPGIAKCQFNISPQVMTNAIRESTHGRLRVAV